MEKRIQKAQKMPDSNFTAIGINIWVGTLYACKYPELRILAV